MENYEEKYQKLQVLKKFRENIGLFGKVCFPTALNRDIPPFHTELYAHLRNESKKRLLVAAPRGTAKSTTVSLIYPLWKVAFKPENEDLFIVIISESQSQSVNFLSRIKYHLSHSKTFSENFGDMGPNTARRWTNNDIILANGSRIIAVGTGQRVRGFIEGDTRPNLIIIDDFESELNAYTSEARAKNRKWITEAVIPSLSDDGRIAMIGTVISEDCFLCWAKESPAWDVLWYSIWDEEENSIWEARFPRDRILQIKDEFASVGNLNGFYQEYMNIAQSPEDSPFKPEYIQIHHYDYEIRDGQNILVKKLPDNEEEIKPVAVYSGVDPASSLSMKADFFVIATVGIDNEGNVYVINIVRTKLDPADQPDAIIRQYKKYKPKRMKIETVAYQEALRSAVRKQMQEQNLYIPGLEKGVKPRTKKSERLLSMVPLLAKKQFYFRPQDIEAQAEFLSYPRGKHDDVMDAIWTALDGSRPSKRKEFVEQTEDYGLGKKVLDWMTM